MTDRTRGGIVDRVAEMEINTVMSQLTVRPTRASRKQKTAWRQQLS